jgi:type I pantothenate kinase
VSAATEAIGALVAAARHSTGPVVVGIAGGVAVGKTTLAAELGESLTGEPVTVVGTDGFLFSNAVLAARGLTARKGFPESFDVARLRGFLVAVRVGQLPQTVPRYSHVTYDIEGEEEVAAAPVVVIEGVNVLAAAADLLHVAVYLDAAESDLETWYIKRFRSFVATAADDPTSFYRRFAGLSDAEITSLAGRVWREVNLVNLRQHIAPSRAQATCIITKGPDQAILDVTTRDDAHQTEGA